MAVKEMTVKERVLKRVLEMDSEELLRLEQELNERYKPSQAEIDRRLEAWRGVFGLLAEPEEVAEFEKHAQRRPLFGGRTLDLEPDDRL